MSDYKREKVLRIPLYKTNIGEILRTINPEGWDDDGLSIAEEVYPHLFAYSTPGKFQVAPTDENYIDYVLEAEYGCDCGEFGKVRSLRKSEQRKYEDTFHKLDSSINMSDVKLVEFCWYNCCEAPDYYEEEKDPFYDEV